MSTWILFKYSFGEKMMMQEGDKEIATNIGITVVVLVGFMIAIIIAANFLG